VLLTRPVWPSASSRSQGRAADADLACNRRRAPAGRPVSAEPTGEATRSRRAWTSSPRPSITKV